MFLETHIHITFDIRDMIQDILDNALLECPAEEVELAHGGLFDRCGAVYLETDPLSATKGIKEPLGIGLEFALVVEVHHELAGL